MDNMTNLFHATALILLLSPKLLACDVSSDECFEEDPADLYLIGMIYSEGESVEKNDAEAFKWYKKAAEQGDWDALYALASMYASGRGTKKDEKEAIRWFKKSAELGNKYSQTRIDMINKANKTPTKEEIDMTKLTAEQKILFGIYPDGYKKPREGCEIIIP